MSTIPFPLINGVRHSWASIELKVAGQLFVGFKSINYTRTRTRTMVYGNSPDPIAKTRGKNEYKCDFELFLAEFNLLQQVLLQLAGSGSVTTGGTAPAQGASGYGDVPFQIIATYSENGLDTIVDTITGGTLDTTDASNSEGTDPTVRKVECNPLKILFNGADDLQFPLVAPAT